MVVLQGGMPLLHRFVDAASGSLAAWSWDQAMPFRDNMQLDAIIDSSNGEPCHDVDALQPFTAELFAKQCEHWLKEPT